MSYDIPLAEHLAAEQRHALADSTELARFVRDIRRRRRPRRTRRFVLNRRE